MVLLYPIGFSIKPSSTLPAFTPLQSLSSPRTSTIDAMMRPTYDQLLDVCYL